VILTPDRRLADEIPGLVGHSYGLTFRNTPPVVATAVADRDYFYSVLPFGEAHRDILRRHRIKYVVVPAPSDLQRQLDGLPEVMRAVYSGPGDVVYEVREGAS
jgi:hypothetical protein